jgi:tetratricopeptide (TPR) repeat protein
VLEEIQRLVDRRPPGDAAALFELASAYDFSEREDDAEPLYRQALDAGLPEDRRRYAVIQLASTVRNLGRPEEAAALLRDDLAAGLGDSLDDARRAFLALALFDMNAPAEALALALKALAEHMSEYGRAINEYADLLVVKAAPGSPTT